MKRTGLTFVAALCLAATSFAAGNQPTTAKWEGNINVNKLSKYLNLDSEQSEEVSNICEYFTVQMERANVARKDKETKLHDAVYGNLKLMKRTLTNEQYAKYAALLNITLKNKGIEVSK
jgi:hypothetical protein